MVFPRVGDVDSPADYLQRRRADSQNPLMRLMSRAMLKRRRRRARTPEVFQWQTSLGSNIFQSANRCRIARGRRRAVAAPCCADRRVLPPWWVWVALVVGSVSAGCLVRRRSLRALEVAPPPTRNERGSGGQVCDRCERPGRPRVGWRRRERCLPGRLLEGAARQRHRSFRRHCRRIGRVHSNAVLVAQDEFDRAERIWNDMSFGRVSRMRWGPCLS